MTNNPVVDEGTRKEWRQLGFYYSRDDKAETWNLSGSRAGLMAFVQLLRDYASNPRNDTPSEHDHYGPYSYLEIMTWDSPGMDDHTIHGPLTDLLRLSGLVERAANAASVGDIVRIREEFAPGARYALLLAVQKADFDPAAADPLLAPAAENLPQG